MAMDLKAIKEGASRHYDKIITVVVVSVLLLSIIYLAVHLGTMGRQQKTQKAAIENLTIENPKLAEVDVRPYELAIADLASPGQVVASNWTQALFVPAERVFCPACSRPSLASGDVCSLCGKDLPKGSPAGRDKDGDEIPDAWERTYKLNAASSGDAHLDADSDGYDNLIEYKGKSDPTDAKSTPDLDAFIILEKLVPNKFNLKFAGKASLSANEVKYQLNVNDLSKTHLKKLGESVDGFKLIGYQEKIETNGMRRTDVSVLRLKRGDRVISLTRSKPQEHQDFSAVFRFELDPAWMKKGTVGGVFDVTWKSRSEKYKIKEIDSRNRNVVLGRLRDAKDIQITSAASPEPEVENDSTPVSGGSAD